MSLKELIIKKSINKRNKEKPFNYVEAESFAIKENDDPLINNSYYFSAHNEEISIYYRLGLRSIHEENWFVILYKGNKYSLKTPLFKVNESPLKVYKEDDLWWSEFDGELIDDNKEKHHCKFKAKFENKRDVIDFTSNMPAIRMAKAIAQEKWSKEFFDDLKNVQGQCHYEQKGLLIGSFILDEEEVEFSLPCVRDHSFGKRDWNYMNNHVWIMAINSNSQLNYSLVSYPSISLLEVGNFHENNSKEKYLLKANYDLNNVSKHKVPKTLTLSILLDDKSIKHAKCNVIDTELFTFQNGEYFLYESIADFYIDKVKYRGIFEIGFNKDQNRFFNQKDLNKLVR